MKLADYLASRELSFEQAAEEIGGVSVSGLRKWVAQERVPRPDQMRRVFVWSEGAVTPNDFVLPHAATIRHVPNSRRSALERAS